MLEKLDHLGGWLTLALRLDSWHSALACPFGVRYSGVDIRTSDSGTRSSVLDLSVVGLFRHLAQMTLDSLRKSARTVSSIWPFGTRISQIARCSDHLVHSDHSGIQALERLDTHPTWHTDELGLDTHPTRAWASREVCQAVGDSMIRLVLGRPSSFWIPAFPAVQQGHVD